MDAKTFAELRHGDAILFSIRQWLRWVCLHRCELLLSGSGLVGVHLPGTRLWRVLEEKISQSKIKDPFLRNFFGVCADEDRPPCFPAESCSSGAVWHREGEDVRDRAQGFWDGP